MYTLKAHSFEVQDWCKNSLDRDEMSQQNLRNTVVGIDEGLELIMRPLGWCVVEHNKGLICLWWAVIRMSDCAYEQLPV